MLVLSILGFAAGILAYLYSFCGRPVDSILNWTMPLCGIGFVILGIAIWIENPNSRSWSFCWKGFYKKMPGWVAPCNWIMFMIVIIYFIWFGIQNGGGVPDVKDGQFVIVDHGRILKILTQQQYDKAREQELRMLATWVP